MVDNITEAIRRRDSVRLSVRQITRESDHEARFKPTSITIRIPDGDRLAPTETAHGHFESSSLRILGTATLKVTGITAVATVYGENEIIG